MAVIIQQHIFDHMEITDPYPWLALPIGHLDLLVINNARGWEGLLGGAIRQMSVGIFRRNYDRSPEELMADAAQELFLQGTRIRHRRGQLNWQPEMCRSTSRDLLSTAADLYQFWRTRLMDTLCILERSSIHIPSSFCALSIVLYR
jgi:hypothetical protein